MAKNETTAKVETKNEELVTVNLFKDGRDYKDDVFVCINGKNKVVKRGEDVLIPKAYKKVLDQSRRQDGIAADLMNEKADEFSAESAARNV